MRRESGATYKSETASKSGGVEIRKALAESEEKEKKRLHKALLEKADKFLAGGSLGLEEEDGEIKLAVEADEPSFDIRDIEGFDLESLAGHPEFVTETRRIGSLEYVVTERVKDAKGRLQAIVRPDGSSLYPEKEDVQAALLHDAALGWRWSHEMSPAQAALIIHHFHKKPKQWLWSATEALLAADERLEPSEAVRLSGFVIDDLIERHLKRSPST